MAARQHIERYSKDCNRRNGSLTAAAAAAAAVVNTVSVCLHRFCTTEYRLQLLTLKVTKAAECCVESVAIRLCSQASFISIPFGLASCTPALSGLVRPTSSLYLASMLPQQRQCFVCSFRVNQSAVVLFSVGSTVRWLVGLKKITTTRIQIQAGFCMPLAS
jgi:hypothetical protein